MKCILTLYIIALLGCSSNNGNEVGGCPNAVIDGSTLSCGGQMYKTVTIGERVWMAENLNYNADGSECYDSDEANCNEYGRLYDWETAQTVCPSGWYLPSIFDWDKLIHSVGGTNAHGFSALFGGYVNSDGYFYSIGYHSYWWSSTAVNDTNAYAFHRQYDIEGIRQGQIDKTYLFSVRCIKSSDSDKEAQQNTIISYIMFLCLGSGLIFLFLNYLINMMGKEAREEMMDTSGFIICQPKAVYMALFCYALIGWCIILSEFDFSIMNISIFLSYLLICTLFTISYFRWKVIVEGNQITYMPYLGKTKSFTFGDITGAERGIPFLSKGRAEYIKIYYSIEDKQYSFSVKNGDLCYYVLISRLEEEDIYVSDTRGGSGIF